jgi:hypothetical protein
VAKFDFSGAVLNLSQEVVLVFHPFRVSGPGWRTMVLLGTSMLMFVSLLYE